ncbi:hypothetical protein HYW84_00545 [Candidatus Peregrinibacteria bacterium]|nr:hypothetical protein [Candidatus Peregrinibacteria bacterium]
MDSLQLQKLVSKSKLLSDEERAYWLRTLPSMKPEHVAKLERILSEGENIHVEEKVRDYFTAVRQAANPTLAT